MTKLNDKIALVTGGSSGIGLATAKRFIADGAQVIITGRSQDALDAALAELGGRATGIRGDVAKLEDLDRLFALIEKQFGRLDVLFANAGIAPFVPFEAVSEEHFDGLFNINVRGLFFTVQKALPLLSSPTVPSPTPVVVTPSPTAGPPGAIMPIIIDLLLE